MEKTVKQSIGWENFKDVFMVSAIHSLGSSDIEVSCKNNFIDQLLSDCVYLHKLLNTTIYYYITLTQILFLFSTQN